eukprot:CAMPEP_0178520208 /NCGR_PEP_ID=MMETSP0696-20121128/27272_1 /TAXON_ID=265572 /ORGANISM="Extubocellulus spinifer, Strain CCMP396" /LENGTH=949 /DNA_ID=CAMNT_0020151031 /DNA_START=185 /DNA_END=3034 /DNA_ORIENTATION=+
MPYLIGLLGILLGTLTIIPCSAFAGKRCSRPASLRTPFPSSGLVSVPPRVHERVGPRRRRHLPASLFATGDSDDDTARRPPGEQSSRRSLMSRIVGRAVLTSKKIRRRLGPVALGLLTTLSLSLGHDGGEGPIVPPVTLRPPAAVARLPIDAVQDTNLDVKQIGMDRAVQERNSRRAAEALQHRAECDKIESTHGTKARKQYEAEYKAAQDQKLVEKEAKREALLSDLLSQGICPFTDTEGIRQVFLFDEDIDLATVEGSEQYYDFVETKAGKGARVQKKYALPRFIIKCQVDDLRVHGKDAVQYFQDNRAKTAKLFDMPERKLKAIAEQYKARIAEYGTINPVTEQDGTPTTATDRNQDDDDAGGQKKMSAMAVAREQKRISKEKARAEKADARAEARAVKEENRAARRSERIRLREEKLTSIKERKEAKAAAKIAAQAATGAAAAAAAHAAADSEIAATAGMDVMTTAGQEAVSPSHMGDATSGGEAEHPDLSPADDKSAVSATSGTVSTSENDNKRYIVPAAAVLGVAGGGYVFKVSRERAAAEEEERQRQFKLIMGVGDEDDDDDDDNGEEEEISDFVGSMGSDFPSLMDTKNAKASKAPSDVPAPPSSPPPVPAPAAKKRFGGIKSVFSKKPGRETDLNKLVAADATAPLFCSTLAKLLTFGAPGRFPRVGSLPLGKSVKEFDLEEARGILREEADKAELSDQDACEEFAKVVNCMIIDIIDLASSTLKEKEDKPTIDALNIVMDFMDHSAGLFEPFLTDGIAIKPVTYGGNLGKGKLEQLYSTYATAVMTSSNVTEERIDMFRELFEIKEKKAEGLVQKKMLSNMMKMMKDPDAMKDMLGGEGMEEMMAAMGGMEGLAGMPGMDEEMSPEQLKESVNMMKELVESGNVSKEDMKLVKEQFKTAYGMDMEELIANADSDEVREQLGDDGEELLEMFKIILEATK